MNLVTYQNREIRTPLLHPLGSNNFPNIILKNFVKANEKPLK